MIQQQWRWEDILIKLDGSKPMWTLTKEERKQNMKGHFLVSLSKAKQLVPMPTEILIVDDIYTTGATLVEAADTLKSYFPRANIKALTLASGA